MNTPATGPVSEDAGVFPDAVAAALPPTAFEISHYASVALSVSELITCLDPVGFLWWMDCSSRGSSREVLVD